MMEDVDHVKKNGELAIETWSLLTIGLPRWAHQDVTHTNTYWNLF